MIPFQLPYTYTLDIGKKSLIALIGPWDVCSLQVTQAMSLVMEVLV